MVTHHENQKLYFKNPTGRGISTDSAVEATERRHFPQMTATFTFSKNKKKQNTLTREIEKKKKINSHLNKRRKKKTTGKHTRLGLNCKDVHVFERGRRQCKPSEWTLHVAKREEADKVYSVLNVALCEEAVQQRFHQHGAKQLENPTSQCTVGGLRYIRKVFTFYWPGEGEFIAIERGCKFTESSVNALGERAADAKK